MFKIEVSRGFDDLFQEIERDVELKDNEVEDIAQIVKEGIEYNLFNALEYDGSPSAPNKSSTVQRKKHNRVYYDEGDLFKSVAVKKLGYLERHVYIAGKSNDVLYDLIQGRPNMNKRNPFGIGLRIENNIDRYISNIKR